MRAQGRTGQWHQLRSVFVSNPRQIPYGQQTHQFGELWLPDGATPAAGWPIVTLVHGGFWRSTWALDLMDPMAASLLDDGCAVWNIEYRRVGHEGGGWPGTGDDVIAAINHVGTIAEEFGLDVGRHGIVGHSAGGHLALWSTLCDRLTTPIALAVGLAPVADLEDGWANGLGNGAISDLLGGTPDDVLDRYREASPAALLDVSKAPTPQAIIQGTTDQDVPLDYVRRYVDLATASPVPTTYDEFRDVGHMELIEPDHPAWVRARDRLLAAVQPTVVLTGFMGTGKSSVGAALAEALGVDFIDTDVAIEAEHGPIPQIFAEYGEGRFRELERDVAAAAASRQGVVVATGGGLMLDPTNREILSNAGRVFALTADASEIIDRVGDTEGRPLLAGADPAARVTELLAERAPVYESFECVATDGRPVDVIAADLLSRLRR